MVGGEKNDGFPAGDKGCIPEGVKGELLLRPDVEGDAVSEW